MTKTRLELTKTRYSLKQCCCTTVVTSLKLNSNTTATDAVSSHIVTGGCYNIFLYTATNFCPRAVLEVEDSPRGPNPWNEEMSLQAFPKKQSVMVLTPRSVAEYSTARKQLREKCWMPMAERRVDRQIHCRSWYNNNKCLVTILTNVKSFLSNFGPIGWHRSPISLALSNTPTEVARLWIQSHYVKRYAYLMFTSLPASARTKL